MLLPFHRQNKHWQTENAERHENHKQRRRKIPPWLKSRRRAKRANWKPSPASYDPRSAHGTNQENGGQVAAGRAGKSLPGHCRCWHRFWRSASTSRTRASQTSQAFLRNPRASTMARGVYLRWESPDCLRCNEPRRSFALVTRPAEVILGKSRKQKAENRIMES